MNNTVEKFLPLGTVVMLKGASKRLMITGFCTMAAEEEEETMYDYSGCMYPEGIISSDQTALFNHDQIEKIYHMGLVDEEEKDFKIKLNQLLSTNDTVIENPAQIVSEVNEPPIVEPIEPIPSVEQNNTVEQPVPPIGPGLPGYVAPQTPVTPVEVTQAPVVQTVAPQAPVAPIEVTQVPVAQTIAPQPTITPAEVAQAPVTQTVTPEQPMTTSNGFQFDAQGNVVAAAQPTQQVVQNPQPQPISNIQFDENGTVVSA